MQSLSITIKFCDFQSTEGIPSEDVSLVIITPISISCLLLGESCTVNYNRIDFQLKSKDSVVAVKTLETPQDFNDWICFNETVQIKLALASQPIEKKIKSIKFNLPEPYSTCDYIKTVQTVMYSEIEIRNSLDETLLHTPDVYKYLLDHTLKEPAKTPSNKKNSLDGSDSNRLDCELSYSSYFSADLKDFHQAGEDFIQNVAVGLLNKVLQLKIDVEEYELTQELISDYDYFIKTLAESLEESKDQCKLELDRINNTKAHISNEISLIDQEYSEILEKVQNTELQILNNKEIWESYKQTNFKIKGLDLENSIKDTVLLRKQLQEIEKQLERLEIDSSQQTQEFLENYPEKELNLLVNQKILLIAELQQLISMREVEFQENISLQSDLMLLEGELDIQSDYIHQITDFNKENKLIFTNATQNNSELTQLISERDLLSKEFQDFKLNLSETLIPLEKNIKTDEEIYRKGLKSQLDLSKTLESLLPPRYSIDLAVQPSQILPDFKRAIEGHRSVMKILESDTTLLQNTFYSHAETSLLSKRLFKKIQETAETQELQQECMAKLITSIKKENPPYIPVKNDSIDLALAKYLNAQPNCLEVTFRRLDKQIYDFGSTRVEVKLDDGIFVDIQGKLYGIEQFLDTYAPLEAKKVLRRSNSRNSNTNSSKSPAKYGKIRSVKS
jgi:hypothetical protein